MKRTTVSTFLAFLGIAVITACMEEGPTPTGIDQLGIQTAVIVSADPPEAICGEEQVVTLWAGQNIDAGTVTVSHDEDNLYVTVETTGGWSLVESHLSVVTDPDDFPTNKAGNPKVGHFEYGGEHAAGATSHTFQLELGDLEAGDEIYVAFHAALEGPGGASESAWGAGTRFVNRGNWATYFSVEIQECSPPPGKDIVVFNDVNPFDFTGMQSPDNQIMGENLVNYAAPGPRASGTTIWFHSGHNPRDNASSRTGTYRALLNGWGYNPLVTSASFLAIPADVKVIFLWTPRASYSVAEINALKQFAEDSGRIVFVGEWDGYYGAAGIAVENSFLQDMGAVMTNTGGAVDCGFNDLPASVLRPHQITTGMNGVRVACASIIVPGPQDFPLFYDSSNTHVLAGVATIDTTPLPAAAPALAPAFSVSEAPAQATDPDLVTTSATGR